MKHKHHILPRHMGGTDDPSNLVELTIEEHALAHKTLYEQFGRWQDYVAWQGLANLDKNFDAAKQAIIEGGKMGAKITNEKWKDPGAAPGLRKLLKEKFKNRTKTWNGKKYEITHPDGQTEIVEGLKQWCVDKGFNSNTFANASLRGSVTNGGYKIRKLD